MKNESNNHFLYKLTFPNGKVYIGQTNNFGGRMSKYKQIMTTTHNKDGNGYLIYNAIRKYKWDNVKQEIIGTTSINFIDDAEIWYISFYNSTNTTYGYNLEAGGCKNKIVSIETRKKQSKARSGKNHHLYGKHHSAESKEKMRISHIGKKASLETRKKQSKARSGKNNGMYGKHHSAKTIEKMMKLTKEQENEIINLISTTDKFPTEIATQYNVGKSTLYNLLKKRNLSCTKLKNKKDNLTL